MVAKNWSTTISQEELDGLHQAIQTLTEQVRITQDRTDTYLTYLRAIDDWRHRHKETCPQCSRSQSMWELKTILMQAIYDTP